MTTDDPKAMRALVERAWDLLAEHAKDLDNAIACDELDYFGEKAARETVRTIADWQADARDAGVWRDA